MNKPLLLLIILLQFLSGPGKVNRPSFQTDNTDRPIIIIGDTQRTSLLEFWREKNKGVTEEIFNNIAGENPCCILHCGDMVFDGSSEKAWKNFKHDAAQIIKNKIPIYPVLGNHEYLGNNKKAMKNVYGLFPFLKESTWYSKRFENLGVIFLNSNFDELTDKQNKEQVAWYINELEKFQNDPSIDFIAVICHHPPFTNSKVVSDNTEVRDNFVRPFISVSKTRFFLSGHCHSYERFEKDGKYFIVSGGGPRQELETKTRRDGPSEAFNGPAVRNFNYCRISLSGEKLVFQMIQYDKETGGFSVGETFELTK